MNERILELAEQARVDGDAIHYYSPLFAEKFAELIVQEMLKLLEQYSRDSFPEDIMDDFYNAYLAGLRNAREAVKKHFGVEE